MSTPLPPTPAGQSPAGFQPIYAVDPVTQRVYDFGALISYLRLHYDGRAEMLMDAVQDVQGFIMRVEADDLPARELKLHWQCLELLKIALEQADVADQRKGAQGQ